jgi:hypothetical protein
VVYQHFYRALPQGGALQVLIYSGASQAWQATSKAAQLFSHLKLDESPSVPVEAVPVREKRFGEVQADASRSESR